MTSQVTSVSPKIPAVLDAPAAEVQGEWPTPNLPRGVTAIIIQYYAPMTCDVVRDHTLWGKGSDAEIRFDYVALARDFGELADLGVTFGVASEVDQVIRAFALTIFILHCPRRDLFGREVIRECKSTLPQDLQHELNLRAHAATGIRNLNKHQQRDQTEFDSYPKVHAVLHRLGLMSAMDDLGCAAPSTHKFSETTLTDKQVSFSSSGRRIISRPKLAPPALRDWGSYT